jgi:hypothetical protein
MTPITTIHSTPPANGARALTLWLLALPFAFVFVFVLRDAGAWAIVDI